MKATKLEVNLLEPHPILGVTGMLSNLARREGEMIKKGGDKKALHVEKLYEINLHLEALRQDIREHGIRKPIQVCPREEKDGYLILDGRHRWEMAMELGLSEVPVDIVSADDAKGVIAASTLNKPMSKGAVAYLAVLIHPEVATAQHGGDRKASSLSELDLTAEALAKKVGVSKALMSDAVKLYHFFHKTGKRDGDDRLVYVPGAKAKYEDAIFSPGGSLRGVISAVVAMGMGEDKPSKGRTPEQKWAEVKRKTQLRIRAAMAPTREHFEKLKGEEREEFVDLMAREFFAQNEDLAEAMARVTLEMIQTREA